jgi:hypothetical protein
MPAQSVSAASHASGRTILGLLAAFATVALIACGSDEPTSTLAPFQPEVMNSTDTFQLQATNVQNVTTTLTYTWQNTGTSANVDQSTVPTAGTASLVIRDSGGAQVYSRDLSQNGSFSCATGAAGAWTIQVTLSGFDGTLNFRAQKP